MPMGLLNPKNAATNTGGGKEFQEGYVKIDSSFFQVVHFDPPATPNPKYPQRADFMGLVWAVTRLDENLEPMTDEQDAPLTENIIFSCGAKSLPNIHPGKADGPEDTDIEDLGSAPKTEGPALFMVNSSWQVNDKSGIHNLYASLEGKVPENLLDRVWAPDWNGIVVFLKSRQSEDKIDGQTYTIKFVDKVVSMGGGKSRKTAGKAGAAESKEDTAIVKALHPIMEAISLDAKGDELSFKTLAHRVGRALKSTGVDAKIHVAVLALAKDPIWLTKNGEKYDMTTDAAAETVQFAE